MTTIIIFFIYFIFLIIVFGIIKFVLKKVLHKDVSMLTMGISFLIMLLIPFALFKGCQSCVGHIKEEIKQESSPDTSVSIAKQEVDEKVEENEKIKRVITFELKEDRNHTITKGDTIAVVTYNEDGKIIESYLPGKIVEWDDEWTRFTAKYDAKGNRIEELVYDHNGRCFLKKIFKYNANNKLIEELTTHYTIEETFTIKYVAKYNDKGLLIEECDSSVEDGYVNYRVTYKYDKKGNQTEYCRYTNDNSIEEKTTNKYDNNGKLILYTYSSEEASQKNTYRYDENGRLAEDCEFDSNNSLYLKKTYKYDDKGFVAEECIEGNGEKTKYVYKHDNNGKELEKCIYKAGTTLESKEVRQYDANGNITEHCIYDANGKIKEKTTYSKDKYKNETIVRKGEEGVFESGELDEFEYFNSWYHESNRSSGGSSFHHDDD